MEKHRMSAAEARYEELPGAVKDGDCTIVAVEGGLSKRRGCCCRWKRMTQDPDGFRCGTCKFVTELAKEYR